MLEAPAWENLGPDCSLRVCTHTMSQVSRACHMAELQAIAVTKPTLRSEPDLLAGASSFR